MSLAFERLPSVRGIHIEISAGNMVSIWWILWAFFAGGFSGMLLVSLMIVARGAGVRSLLDRL